MRNGIEARIRRLELHGEMVNFRYGEWAEEAKARGDVPVPGTDLYLPASLPWHAVMRIAGIEGSWDYSLPQDWFDAYIAEHGKRPEGVWWYGDPEYRLFGRFLSLEEIVKRIGEEIVTFELA